ncbi:hypothetical protein IC620_16055 [Hazenella sp. IB182357]|uniref:Uncharacterized protein n=1 Tax=Polycladospora coralii TaxID=2771432 RepID=A0A926RVR1_9BACL|nr:hypothetical protein [Polycladospora coralii]MBD1373859.1 hypothetical protein [Polycladospora coralii]
MTTFDYVMVGKAIRNKRKEKRLRIEELADENIFPLLHLSFSFFFLTKLLVPLNHWG